MWRYAVLAVRCGRTARCGRVSSSAEGLMLICGGTLFLLSGVEEPQGVGGVRQVLSAHQATVIPRAAAAAGSPAA